MENSQGGDDSVSFCVVKENKVAAEHEGIKAVPLQLTAE